MPAELCKSPMQLKYELDKINKELITLTDNYKKKKEEYLGQMVNFRAELKEIDAVMAATEVSYTSYCALTNAIRLSNLPKLSEPGSLQPDFPPFFAAILNQLIAITRTAEEAEAIRITQLRQEHQDRSVHIQQKTKDIYGLMNKENKNVETYTTLLQAKILELKDQLDQLQTKDVGLGIGL
ncbi:hypothetical protein AHMF7605_01885 [Adhaeribacter arboris]|uniref:Uncharacterized protein n=1 Tax=Adhaeribacter arboris TaxID=2072846 RepID=A0A2T2YA27_9BACT|nr:hypothetical protein [Adhaeribacter arboris]PSR52359.1 hypothetical protein AHMF7605_01885 [Adhaeribacter arboris]